MSIDNSSYFSVKLISSGFVFSDEIHAELSIDLILTARVANYHFCTFDKRHFLLSDMNMHSCRFVL